MIDVHAHVLPFVDDGSKSLEQSLAMLVVAQKQGVTDMVLTPHLRKEYDALPKTIKEVFCELKKTALDAGIFVNLHYGQEVFITNRYKEDIASGKILTINDGKHILIEFDYEEDFDIAETVYELSVLGYIPIVAHFERYLYADLSVAQEIKSLGGYIQVNADSFFGKGRRKYYGKIKKLINEGLVDFVASDVHAFRENYLGRARVFITKKFGQKIADALFIENARKILNG